MSNKVMVAEEPLIIPELFKINPEDIFQCYKKGPEWIIDDLDEDAAKIFSEFDIIIIQKNIKKAEEFRKMLLKYTNKDIIIVRYLYDGYISKEGDFQVIKLTENFVSSEIYNALYPWLEGYKTASQLIEKQNKQL